MWDIAPESARSGHPELAAQQPVGDVRPAAVLARGQLLDRHQPVHHGQGGRRALPRRRHQGRDRPDPPDVGPDGRRERPVLHGHGVGEAQPGRHRRRRQRQPRARLGQRPGLQPEPLRRGRAAGHRGLQDLDRRPAARRAGVGAGHAPDPVRRARLALGPRRGQPLVQAHRRRRRPGTSGTVRVPLLGRSRTVAMDGAVVWQDGRSGRRLRRPSSATAPSSSAASPARTRSRSAP